MLRLAIIEDEPKARQVLHALTQQFCPDFEICGEAGSVKEGKIMLEDAEPDLLLLDIRLTDGTGFDLLRQLPAVPFKVIFVTAFDEYAIEAFQVSALDYILKPITPDSFKNAMERARELIVQASMQLQIQTLLENFQAPRPERKIILKTLESLYVLKVAEIVRLQSEGSYTTFFLQDGREILVSRGLREYEKLLGEQRFFRTHQSHLINLDFLKEFKKKEDSVLLDDASRVPVASRKRDPLIKAIQQL